MKFSINKKVFEKYPDLVVYIPVVKGFDNSSRGSDEVSQMVLEAEESVKTRFKNIESVEDDLSVKKYFDAFRAFGVNPKKVKPTHYALIKRIVQGGRLPRINSVVDIYNSISIKYVTPFGGEDLNQLYGDFYLEFAKGGEHWLGISEDKPKGAVKGDLIWRDDYDVSTLSLNWRQCERTKITEDSKNGYFIMDCWENVNDENAFKAAEEFCKSVEKNCGGKYQIYKLDSKNNECEVDFETKKIDGIEVPEKVKIENSDATKTINLSKKQQEETVYNYPQNSLEDRIQLALLEGLYIQKIDIAKNQIPVEKSTSSAKGDLSSTIVLRVAKKYGQNPIELSKIIAGNLSPVEGIAKVEAVAPGFINFFVDGKSVVEVLDKIITQKSDFGRSEKFAGQKWVVEHTSPNPNKSMHLGHMRTNLTGMAVANLIEACGANVIRDCIDNNRGIAIAKLMWGYLKFANKNGFENLTIEDWAEHKDQWYTPQELGKNPGKYMDELYVKGSTDFKEDKEVERVVRDYVVRWENEDKVIWDLWKHVLDFAYQGQKITLDRLGNRWDKVWHENEHYKQGKNFVDEGLKKGIFKKDQGAIITQLESYKIPNTVVIKSDGTALYITQDIALTNLKKTTYKPDKLIWVIGPEQALALKQMFAVCEQLGIGKVSEFIHLPYGYMSIKGQGKMSSRTGNVVYIDDLIDMARDKVLAHYEGKESELSEQEKLDIAEKVSVGAVKYSILKVGRMTDLAFDFDASLSFEGDSAPYIMYSYVRTSSVLKQAGVNVDELNKAQFGDYSVSPIEEGLMKKLAEFPSIVENAAVQFAPNYVCTYLYELAQSFSEFYNGTSIIKAESESAKNLRLKLTFAVGQVIKNGLKLLGVETVEKM